jgi:hypothetical protein
MLHLISFRCRDADNGKFYLKFTVPVDSLPPKNGTAYTGSSFPVIRIRSQFLTVAISISARAVDCRYQPSPSFVHGWRFNCWLWALPDRLLIDARAGDFQRRDQVLLGQGRAPQDHGHGACDQGA